MAFSGEIGVSHSPPITSALFTRVSRIASKGLKAGDMLKFTIKKDSGATAKVADQTRKVQADLKKNDPGGDVKL